MDKKLAEVGLSDYSLSFALPHITSSTSGNATFDYTERIGSFIIKADYASADGIYLSISSIGVPYSMATVSITGAVGEPIKTDVSYTVLTPLAEGDRAEDLGIEFVFDGIDVNTAGRYALHP